MPRKSKREEVKQYTHDEEKRLNNPPVGLVTAETDHLNGRKLYQFDPHLDPQLQWAGKTEGASFVVDTVSLHVHERIDPLTIIQSVKRKELREQRSLIGYFESDENNPPIQEAIEFYKHAEGWSNRLIAGDSLLVMNSLLEKESMAGKIQMIYFDPPYGIKYSSNFQPFVDKREVQDGKDQDLTQEPEMIKAFRDTWELGIHSYLSYLRDRLALARELLTDSGSIFVQISDENLHHVKELLDEVFGSQNFRCLIIFRKTTGKASALLDVTADYLLWYSKDNPKFNRVFVPRSFSDDYNLRWVEWPDLKRERLSTVQEIEKAVSHGARVFRPNPLTSQTPSESTTFEYEFNGRRFSPGSSGWKTNLAGMDNLRKANRLMALGNTLCYVRYLDDFPYKPVNNIWDDTRQSGFGEPKTYVVQTSPTVLLRCILMTTDPGDIVFDPTCGSGTTAYAAEQLGRRWITCDTSRVAIALTKQRLMTSLFEYYELAHSAQGVSGGFKYTLTPHVMLRSIANTQPPDQEILYDRPRVDPVKRRVTGPFTLEAVPSIGVRSLEEDALAPGHADNSIVREGQTSNLNMWIDELLAAGVRGTGGQKLGFARVELMAGTRWIQAEGETDDGRKAAISFGPEYAPLERRQIELAIEEAQEMVPKPRLVLFAAFQFDPEAAKDIDALKWPGVDVLKVQMNTDLFTSDLKKHGSSSEPFWLIGQPDIELKKVNGKYEVLVNGFDYYNTRTGKIESGDTSRIAMWELDTDYDGRSLYPRQVFFPLAGSKSGWDKITRTLRTFIDEELMESYKGNKSLPFLIGDNKQIAVKIIDDRGIESLRVIKVRD
jgi:adenine-specific DNA-methyltransferase